jgi:hypothetical protein
MYELVQKSHKKCTNWYKRHNMYKFVLVNLYTKISKKKDLHPGWDFNPGPISALEIVALYRPPPHLFQ